MDDRELFVVNQIVEVLHRASGLKRLCIQIAPRHWETTVQGQKVKACSRLRCMEVAKGDLITEAGADQVDPNRSIYEDQGLKSVG